MGPQTSIAHYRIIAKLGEGGMGIVYRATDTKLNRDVAIKVLPDSVAEDSDRLARFSREAQVLASLNHPNIAAIYGVEDRALIMELVEGPTLEQRLAQGAIRIADALPIACQIAEALEYAHDRGVIHRDLKPANVKVTPEGRVKVLDFGLAKALATESAAIDPASSPTMTMRATMAGVIMGTAAYMSPEQAKGKPVDRRTDIWAFGVLFAEMLSGRMMYSAETVSETLAAVLLKEPDLSTIPAGTPSAVRRTLRRCLEKDVTRRLQAIGEARIAIDEPEDTALQLPAPVAPVRRGAPWWALGAVSIVALAMPVLWWRASRPVEHPLQRFVVDFGPNSQAGTSTSLAISRDGTRIVYSVNPGDAPVVSAAAALSQRMLATRRLDQSQGTVLAGTEDASNPFFSPDGRWIAFFASRKLKKVSVDGGAPAVLCDAPNQRGGDWGEDGYIVAAFSSTGGLMRVPSSGGTPEPFSKLNDGEEKTHRYPQILPGGAVLVTSSKDPNLFDTANAAVVPAHGGAAKVVQRQGTFAHYLPSGHLVFIRDETLFGVAFDLNRSETRGTPVPLLDGLTPNLTSGGGQFSFSHSGTFAFLESRFSNQASPLVSLSATGTEEPLTPPLGPRPFSPEYSPDGKRIALTAGKSIVVYDLERRGTDPGHTGIADGSPFQVGSRRKAPLFQLRLRIAVCTGRWVRDPADPFGWRRRYAFVDIPRWPLPHLSPGRRRFRPRPLGAAARSQRSGSSETRDSRGVRRLAAHRCRSRVFARRAMGRLRNLKQPRQRRLGAPVSFPAGSGPTPGFYRPRTFSGLVNGGEGPLLCFRVADHGGSLLHRRPADSVREAARMEPAEFVFDGQRSTLCPRTRWQALRDLRARGRESYLAPHISAQLLRRSETSHPHRQLSGCSEAPTGGCSWMRPAS